MKGQKFFQRLFWLVLIIILLTPVVYWTTGIGQAAPGLPADISRSADNLLLSSPKAEARHTLLLAMRIQSIIMYPLLLLSFQLGGGALLMRQWLNTRIQPALTRQFPRVVSLSARLGNKFPDSWRSSLPGRDIVVILLFVTGLNLGIFLLYLPFNFYRGFIVNHQFGLSNLTATGWLVDWSKSVIINLGVAGLAWTAFYSMMRLMPRRWPVPGGFLLVLSNFFFVLITPIVITPIFYNVSTLDDSSLQERILALAHRAGTPVDEIHVIDASSKTTAVNAYVTGFGGVQRIVLYDNLLAGYTADQIEVVLAHELGHWHYQHVLLSILGLSAVAWIGLFVLRWLLNKVWLRLRLNGPADIAGLPFILALIAILSALMLPVENGLSRFGERQADEYALSVSQKPGAFVALFEQFAEQNLSVVDAPTWEKTIFFSHPPIAERIYRAEAIAKELQDK
jgi:STE24 endopeptidase